MIDKYIVGARPSTNNGAFSAIEMDGVTCSFILESSKVTWTRLTGTNWMDSKTAGLNLALIICISSPQDTEGETSVKLGVTVFLQEPGPIFAEKREEFPPVKDREGYPPEKR